MYKIKLSIQVKGTTEKTIPLPDDWEEMDDEEKNDYITECAEDFMYQTVACTGTIIEDS